MSKKKITLKQFLIECSKIHGNEYDYSMINNLENSHEKLPIICKKHGIFYQSRNSHITKRYGCPKCGYEKMAIKNSNTTKEFIEESKLVHGNRYDYSLVNYKSKDIKVKIICKEHGIFEQRPRCHLAGQNCPKCSREIITNKISDNKDSFIEKAKKIHGDNYDYSLIEYEHSKQKVKIICNSCKNIFYQSPNHHLSGKGCPFCVKSKGELFIKTFLDKKKLKYEQEKSFEDLIYKGRLRFDFYVNKYNLLIEFNGYQHYHVVKGFSNNTEETLKIQKERDKLKNNYALKNGFNYLVIPYNFIDKLDIILNNVIKSLRVYKIIGKLNTRKLLKDSYMLEK